jgi:hypothetical protein
VTLPQEGYPGHEGVNIRALSDLFALRDERHDTHVFNIGVSVLEVYNDQVPSRRRARMRLCVASCLVSSRFAFRWRSRRTFWSSAARRQRRKSEFVVAAALPVRLSGPDTARAMYPTGLTSARTRRVTLTSRTSPRSLSATPPTVSALAAVVLVNSVTAVLALLKTARENRSTSSTSMNEHSSRSHSLVFVNISVLNRATEERTMGRLVLVDLAGSERIKRSEVRAGHAVQLAAAVKVQP